MYLSIWFIEIDIVGIIDTRSTAQQWIPNTDKVNAQHIHDAPIRFVRNVRLRINVWLTDRNREWIMVVHIYSMPLPPPPPPPLNHSLTRCRNLFSSFAFATHRIQQHQLLVIHNCIQFIVVPLLRNTRRRRRRLHTLTRTHNKSFRIRYTKLSQLLFELSKMLSNYRSLYKMIEKEKWREKSTSMCHLDSMLILLLLAFTFFFRSFIASTVVQIVVVVLYSCIFEFIVCSPNAVPHMPNLLCNIFIYYYDYSKRLLFDRYM